MNSIHKWFTGPVHEQPQGPATKAAPFRLSVVSATDVGQRRTVNEDSAYATERLIAVADGMGGHAHGEIASQLVVRALAEAEQRVLDGVSPLNAMAEVPAVVVGRIQEQVERDSETRGMGTTMTAMCFDGVEFAIAHVGDSRAYVLRDGRLRPLTRDHTFVRTLVDEGRMTEEAAATHPRRSMLVRALQFGADTTADLSAFDVRSGDRFLVCSDGLTDVVGEDTIREILSKQNAREAADALVAGANAGGGPDNITVVIADVRQKG